MALGLAACAGPQTVSPLPAEVETHTMGLSPVGFDRLPGWRADHLAEALPAFAASCGHMKDAAKWRAACAAARAVPLDDEAAARAFFESNFQPYAMSDNGTLRGMFTAYYEPEVAGSRTHSAGYDVPLYGMPTPRTHNGRPEALPDRAAIGRGALARRNLERFWLADPVDAFFLEIQGSGRVRLPDGSVVRVSYAGENGGKYVAIGRVLIDRGELTREETSLQTIRAWLVAHPGQSREVMERNPSYVFFRELPPTPLEQGPPGAMDVALTPGRSIAVDRSFVPLGTPMWLDTTNAINGLAIQRLMVAQDTGGAIKGPVRADLFLGWGPEAAELAGRMKQPGMQYMLVPRGTTLPFTS